ncbi:Disease resistance protein RPP5, partial [Mucuna pruriens]
MLKKSAKTNKKGKKRKHEDLKKGESIAPALLQAIQGSPIFIVVFSKDYASSTWCLRELVQICNCIATSSRHVLSIFYDVHPSEVRKQSGYFEKAFDEHKQRFREDKEKMEEVQRWRDALTQVANISGFDVKVKKYASRKFVASEAQFGGNGLTILEQSRPFHHTASDLCVASCIGYDRYLESMKSTTLVPRQPQGKQTMPQQEK